MNVKYETDNRISSVRPLRSEFRHKLPDAYLRGELKF
jgi:hypothetical protein